jgi:hypothetical protein
MTYTIKVEDREKQQIAGDIIRDFGLDITVEKFQRMFDKYQTEISLKYVLKQMAERSKCRYATCGNQSIAMSQYCSQHVKEKYPG